MDPVLSPDASMIVFSYEDDLWSVPVSGGQASRLTAMDGVESLPQISPDGKWLAFSGTQFGNQDIFVMPMTGGEITRLTWHQAADELDSWAWDSKTLYFTSGRENNFTGFTISREGGTPQRLFSHYFNRVHNLAEHPKSGEIFFNESWESKNFAHRKRYKGAYNPDIKSYNPKKEAYKEYTDYEGKDFGVSIDKKGNIYFMSDEANGEYNLYTFDGSTKKQLTKFESSILWPQVSANGEKIVFRRDYQIHVYDVASGKTTTPEIKIFKNTLLAEDRSHNTKGNISTASVSPDKKKIAFVSRGRMFVSDIKGKFIREINTDPNEAVREVNWLKDNKTILFSQSKRGYYNWYTMPADGSAAAKELTNDTQNNRLLSFDSEREKAVYISGRNEIRIMDLEDFSSKTIVSDELWGFYNDAPSFSPDDRYILYTAYRNFERDVFVYDLEDKKSMNLTHTKVSEVNPAWSPDGKYIYFSSDRTQPSYPYGTRNSHIYRLALDKFEAPFKGDKWDELFAEEEEEKEDDEASEDDENKDDEEEEEDEDKVQVSINTEKLMERMTRIGPYYGEQSGPYVIQSGEKITVLYISDHDEGSTNLWKTELQDFERPKTSKIGNSPVYGYQISKVDDSYYMLTGGKFYSLSVGGGSMEEISLEHAFTRNLEEEFQQMYYEAWAGIEQNFYDENFHGENWQARRDQYAAFLPYVNSRSNFRLLFNDMLGELNTSHFGFYSNGAEEEVYFGESSLGTGLEFDNEDPYLVSRIITDGPADVKDKDVKPGDRLVAVNGVRVDTEVNREKYFSVPKYSSEITLTLSRSGEEHQLRLRPVSYGAIGNLLYNEWQDANQKYVDEKSNKKIAYVHMKNMGGGELQSFLHDMVAEGAYRDGIILDLRYNTGGNVHDDVLRFLSQRPYLQWKYREGELTPQSNFGPAAKPIVLLINEQSLSDAEMTANGFKELGLGTVIGTETYRWIIFTSGAGLVDGSFYRLPSWGCYTLDGRNLEKDGVAPDIEVQKNFVDRLKNRHPQLDRAISEIMKQL